MFIVDCGLAFPDADMLGVDLVIPDFTYVEKESGSYPWYSVNTWA